MIRENSPTLQRMIASVKPGDGNMQTAQTPMSGQFQSPYPSPKDMVMQAGMNTPVYNAYQIPNNTISMVNGIPMDSVPVTYNNIPGLPTNPDLAHMAGKTEFNPIVPPPGRYMPNNATSRSLYGQAMTNNLNNQQRIVGGFSGYTNVTPFTPPMPAQQFPNNDFYGNVNIYNGQFVHPYVNSSWYGSPDHPFEKSTDNAMTFSETMRNRFNQMFPGYMNPYMGFNFGQPVNNIPPEVQDLANIAAFHGMSYNQFMENSSNAFKMMSRHANRYLGKTDSEIIKRERLYDLKKVNNSTTQVPEDKDQLFYPSMAFDNRGQLTREFQGMFCIAKESLEKAKKKLKVAVIKGDEVIECHKRPIDFTTSRSRMDMWYFSDNNHKAWLNNNKFRFADMYWRAPERQLDHIDGNVFQVTSKVLAFAEQKELEEKLRYQNYTRSSTMFNRADYISTLKGIRDKSRANSLALKQKEWNKLVNKVAGDNQEDLKNVNPNAPNYYDRPYICDGDWIYAKEGVDIVGIPIEQSVNKIIAMNTVTGEEEIFKPGMMMGDAIRERIKAALKPSFNEIDDKEFSRRLEIFKNAAFEI